MSELLLSKKTSPLPFILYSAFGIFMFFVPITIGEKTTIPVDHIISALYSNFPVLGGLYALIIMFVGLISSILEKKWSKFGSELIFSIFNCLGLFIGIAVFFEIGPEWLLDKKMAPYIFTLVAVPVGILIPIGSIFLAFLVNYGLMEFAGRLLTPFMRPIFHTPGRAAIDAVASFAGSYSVGLIITNNVYKSGGYTAREAAIIATGFSTVSATFMVIVAKTVGFAEIWNTYFWTTLLVTFIVTAITVRLPPISRIPNSYYSGATPKQEGTSNTTKERIFAQAWQSGVDAGNNAPGLVESVVKNLKDGIRMAMGVVSAILSFGVIALLLAKYTSIFEFTGYLFYPIFKVLHVPEAALAGQAASVSLADMFLPAILCADAPAVTRFVIGSLCISEVLFFSGMLPCLMNTDIPLSMRDIFLIWFERVVLSIIVLVPIANFIV